MNKYVNKQVSKLKVTEIFFINKKAAQFSDINEKTYYKHLTLSLSNI